MAGSDEHGAPRAAPAGAPDAPEHGFADHYATHPAYRGFPQERRRAGTVPLEMLRAEQGEVDAVDPALPFVVPTLALDAAPRAEARFHCGDGWFGGPARRGELLIHPPDADVHYRLTGPQTILAAPLPLLPLAQAMGREPAALASALAPLSAGLHASPLVEGLMRGLWAESSRGDPAAQLFVDGATLALGAALLRLAGEAREAAPPRLDDRRLARAVERVEAGLGEPLTLRDLAGAAALSPWHFHRAFAEATGLTPARYVQARRVARARRLLAGPMPLAEVAFAAGFASQSHFGQVFREHTGATPGAYRAELRG